MPKTGFQEQSLHEVSRDQGEADWPEVSRSSFLPFLTTGATVPKGPLLVSITIPRQEWPHKVTCQCSQHIWTHTIITHGLAWVETSQKTPASSLASLQLVLWLFCPSSLVGKSLSPPMAPPPGHSVPQPGHNTHHLGQCGITSEATVTSSSWKKHQADPAPTDHDPSAWAKPPLSYTGAVSAAGTTWQGQRPAAPHHHCCRVFHAVLSFQAPSCPLPHKSLQ